MEKTLTYAGLAILTLLIALSAFIGLNELPIRLWDESRLAMNALEMYENGFSLITTFEYKTDLWNTKPPLLIWLQWGMMHLIGPNELAVRIPSAMAVVITALSLIYFSKRITGKRTIGIFASLTLITCTGFIRFHAGRSGDYDALLAMFMTLASLLFFVANQNKFSNSKENIGVFIFLALGVLTKSIAALLFAPAFLFLLIFSGTLVDFFKRKSNYIGLVVFVFLVGGYYLSRELAQEGYLAAVWVNDLFGRYATPLDNHRGSFTFYLENFVENDFRQYFLFSLIGLVLAIFRRKDKSRAFLLYSATIFFTFLLIISQGQTKLSWYLIPALPFAAILAGSFFSFIEELLTKTDISSRFKYPSHTISIILVLFFFFQPYYDTLKKNYKEKDGSGTFYSVSKYLQESYKQESLPSGYAVLYSEYAAHKYFYVRLHQRAGTDVDWKYIKDIQPDDKVIVEGNYQFNYLREISDFKVLWEEQGGKVKGIQILKTFK
ncbi:MAG: glycosyltransferase family 39 protein [Cryomorphaceae bacterium]